MKRAVTFISCALAAASLLTVMTFVPLEPQPLLDSAPPAEAAHQGGVIGLLALDLDPTGNTVTDSPSGGVEETTLGTIESCLEVTHPATFQVDVVVSDYPADTDSLVAYDIMLTFPAGLRLTDSVTGHIAALGKTLISADPQSGSFFAPQVDEPNYGTGAPLGGPATHSVAIIDFAPLDADESIDGEENSDGHLARYTFETTATGPAELPLSLDSTSEFLLDDDGGMPIAKVQNGVIAVDRSCAGLTPPPGPTNVGTATEDPQDQTPSGDTPPADDDGASPGDADGASPDDDQGTPTGDDIVTPAAGGTDQTTAEGGEDSDDGGIGTAGWIGIGIGAVAAALAALAAAAWVIRARGRSEA
jgi:hypothetical protein